MTIQLLLLAAVVFGFALVVAGRTARRFAFRELLRRPIQMLLASTGTGLGVALLVSSLTLADSVEESVGRISEARLGPVDVSIRLVPGRVDEQAELVVGSLPPELVRANLLLRSAILSSAPAGDGPPSVAEPETTLFELDFAEAAKFGPEPVTGLPLSGPAAGDVYISAPLAASLGLREGDRIRIGAGEESDFRVSRVLGVRGIAGYARELDKPVFSVWVPLGTLPASVASGEILVALAGSGGSGDGPKRSTDTGDVEERSRALHSAIEEVLSAGTPPRPGFEPVKASLETASAKVGRLMRSRLLQVTGLAGLAAVALVLSIFLLATEEQGRRIGILRSLGMRRSQLTGVGGGIGAAVGAVGSLIGGGLGVSAAVIALRIAGSPTGGVFGGVRITPSFSWLPLMVGALVGVCVAGFASMLASGRWASLPPAAAIRSLTAEANPLRLTPVVGGVLLMAVGVTMVYVGLNEPQVTWAYVGGPTIAVGAGLFAYQTQLRYPILLGAAAASISWILGLDIFWRSPVDAEGVGGAIGAGVVTVVAGATVASIVGPLIGAVSVRAIRNTKARLPVVTLVSGYAPSRRAQAGFIIATFGMVVLMLVAVITISGLELKESDQMLFQQAGGWTGTVELRSAVRSGGTAGKLQSGKFSSDIEAARDLVRYPNMVVNLAGGGDARVTAYAVDPETASSGFLPLVARASEFDSDADAWRSINEGPTVIVSAGSMPKGVAIFQSFIRHRGSEQTWRVAGVTNSNIFLPGIYGSAETLNQTRHPPDKSMALIRIRDGRDQERLAKEIQGEYFSDSARVTLARDLIEMQMETRSYVTRVTLIVLSVSVLVGLVGLGVMMARSVRARRRDLAILRAVGAGRAMIGRLVVLEGCLQAGTGISLGVIGGIYVGTRIFSAGSRFARPGLPLLTILGVAVLVLLVGSLGGIWPAVSAARTPPVEALRRADG